VIVVDASGVLEVLLRTRLGSQVEESIFAPGETLHAPHLIDLEVIQVLRHLESRSEVSRRRANVALETFNSIRLNRYPHTAMLARIWELRRNLTSYDAAYVALAEALNAPLLTCDRALSAAPGIRVRVRVIPEL